MSGASVQRGKRETEKEAEKFRFSLCSLSCQPHRAQAAAGSKEPSESWSYQGRKLSFASWAPGLFWGHSWVCQLPVSVPSCTSHWSWEMTGQERGIQEPCQLSSSRNKTQGRKVSARKDHIQLKVERHCFLQV